MQALGHPVLPMPGTEYFLFGKLVQACKWIWGDNAIAFTLFAGFITFGQALYLQMIASKHHLFHRPNYLPSFTYIIICSLHPAMGMFSAPLILNWFILGGLDTILSFTRREDQPRTIFNAGFLFACGALWFFPAIAYILFFGLSLILLRPFKLGEWIVAILGYLIPFYFAFCLLYLFNDLASVRNWPMIGISLPRQLKGMAYLPGVIIGSLILLGAGVYTLSGDLMKLTVSVRRSWGAIVTALVIAIFVSVFTPYKESGTWVGLAPAMALLIVPPMMAEKRSRFATFTFYFIIFLVLYCQFTLHP